MSSIEIYDDVAETLRTAIGRNKIKYAVLDNIIDLPHINTVHINLDSIFSFITAKYLMKSDEIDESYRYVIASSILNTVAHYRHYCIRHGWLPTIYMYVTNKWSETVESSLRIIEIISNYLEKIYFLKVNRDDMPCIYMKYFIEKSKGTHLILTKDLLDLQLISKKAHIIHLNKDNSTYYSPENIYSVFLEDPEYVTSLSHKLIGPVLFYSGTATKNSGVKGSGRKKTVKLFSRLADKGIIANGRYHSYEDLVHDLEKEITEDFTNLRTNFEKYDLGTKYNKVMTTSKQKILDSYIIDKFAKKDLLDLNNKYFTGYDSLMLEYLLEVPADPKAGGPKNLRW